MQLTANNHLLSILLLSLSLAVTRGPTRSENTWVSTSPQTSTRSGYGPPRIVGRLKSRDINESSGLVASKSPGFYWTHNDSGDGPFIYAIDEKGESRGVWRVAGASANDWEDIAAGPGPDPLKRYLYIGDIGDNDSQRSEVVVYRIPEPSITAADIRSTKRRPRLTEPAESIKLRYPDGKHDAETLLVHPTTGDLYVISKLMFGKASAYKAAAPLNTGSTTTLVRKADLNVPSLLGGLITGGDIAPDGHRLALCDYLQGYVASLPEGDANFDDIWQQPLKKIDLGKRPQGESIAYRLDGKALLTTSEGVGSPVIEVVVH